MCVSGEGGGGGGGGAGGKKSSFLEKFGVLCFLENTHFEIRLFALLPTNFALKFVLIKLSQTSKNTFQRHSIPVSVIIFLGFYWLNC